MFSGSCFRVLAGLSLTEVIGMASLTRSVAMLEPLVPIVLARDCVVTFSVILILNKSDVFDNNTHYNRLIVKCQV